MIATWSAFIDTASPSHGVRIAAVLASRRRRCDPLVVSGWMCAFWRGSRADSPPAHVLVVVDAAFYACDGRASAWLSDLMTARVSGLAAGRASSEVMLTFCVSLLRPFSHRGRRTRRLPGVRRLARR